MPSQNLKLVALNFALKRRPSPSSCSFARPRDLSYSRYMAKAKSWSHLPTEVLSIG
jgi:hypothetical protein